MSQGGGIVEHILIVDDGRENREFIAEYVLKPHGYAALMARDGREGLEMIQRHKPDLILLDLQMPRMNGVEMLRAMNEQGIDIPVVLMTFYGSEEIAVEVYRLGVKDYVKKPFSIEEMLMAIERSLGDSRLRREKEVMNDRLIAANLQLQRSLNELNILYSIGKSVTSLTDMDQLLPRIVEAAVRVAEAEQGALYLLDGATLVCRARRGRGGRATADNTPANDSFAMRTASERKPMTTALAAGGSSAAAPLVFNDEVIGVLEVTNTSPGAAQFNEHHCALLSTLSDYGAIAIENSRNYERLRQTKEQEKLRIVDSFGRFVSPGVVRQVVAQPESVRPGGENRVVTILFADMRGYTHYAETMPPAALLEMLNRYLSLAGEAILQQGGMIDKYLGDGLMAIFNALGDQPDHVLAAVRAGVALQDAIARISDERGDGVAFGVGISTGEAIVGYLGGEHTLNYTAIGDVVNVARRLTEAARAGQTLIDEAVADGLQSMGRTKALGELRVRGRSQPVRAYEIEDIHVR
jgi:class 3 adenylate cyclase/DNA-binding response OmpR family regulator